MRPPLPRLHRALAVSLSVSIGFASFPAYADPMDVPLLTGIITSLAQQLVTLNQTLATAKQAYSTAATMAGYAGDAVQAYNEFKGMNGKLFAQNVEDALNAAYPDIAFFNRQLSGQASWDQGTGALQPQLVMCFSDYLASATGTAIPTPKCSALQQGLQLDQVTAALTAVFGDVAPYVGSQETKVADHEAAKALAASQNAEQKNVVGAAQAAALLAQCQGGSAANCTAAGSTAQIQALVASQQLSNQLAELTRLQAVRVAQESATRKRQINEVFEQHQLLNTYAVDALGSAPPTIDTDGFNLVDNTGSPAP